MSQGKQSDTDRVISYLQLRKTIGVLGIALPFVLSIGAWLIFGDGLQHSVSNYYHTNMGGILVGTMCVVGFFMFAYRGYDNRDNRAGNLACIFAVGVALFPCAPDSSATGSVKTIGNVHFYFAAAFFLTLIYFSYHLFTQTDPENPPTPEKLKRNKIYKACAFVMAGCMLGILIYKLLPAAAHEAVSVIRPIYWCEAFAILAFGFSWYVKGETILRDKTHS